MGSTTERQLSAALSRSVSPLGSWPCVSKESMLRLITPDYCSPCPQGTGSYSRHKQRFLRGSKRCYESKTWQGNEWGGRARLAWVGLFLPFPSSGQGGVGAVLGELCTGNRAVSG